MLANLTGGSAAPTAISTTTLFAGSNGQVLAFLNGAWSSTATTTNSCSSGINCTFDSNIWSFTSTYGYPFTAASTFATTTAATTTSIWTNGVFFASSTAAASVFPYASSTAFTVSGTGYFGLGAFTSSTGTTTIASGQGLTVGGSQFVVQQGSGNVGIATANPNYKLDVNGSVNVSSQLRIPATVVGGSAVCLNGYLGLCSSDARLKHDIRYLEDGALEKVISLKPATYIFNTDMSSTTRAGFIAQDTLPFIPEAVGTNSEGFYTWDTTAVVSYGVKAIQS